MTVRNLAILLGMISCSGPAEARDWKQIQSSDTLALYSNGKYTGSMTHTTSVNGDTESIIVETRVHVASAGLSADETSIMDLRERRKYGFDGCLKSAEQDLKSASGSTTWSLAGKNTIGWTLSLTAGGATSVRRVPKLSDNLGMTWNLYAGIKNHGIKPGDVFHDTAMELASGQPCVTTITCKETPSLKNRRRWVFSTCNAITARNERWELDTGGRTMYQEVWPFVARIKTGDLDTAPDRQAPALFETLAVPAKRAAKNGECIRLTLDDGMAPDSSVSRLYRKSGKSHVVRTSAPACPENPPSIPEDTGGFTLPTATMQSNDARIVKIADSLVRSSKGRCDSIRACFEWVNRTLEKRYSPTFSSALETLNAGFGDCGEHAVLLGALLRATGIPARVMLGLVYVDSRKGYIYHAWVTACAGGGIWIFADPALGVFPAVRDRVPLVIDDTGSAVMRIAKMLGRIRIDYVADQRGTQGG